MGSISVLKIVFASGKQYKSLKSKGNDSYSCNTKFTFSKLLSHVKVLYCGSKP